MSSAIDCTDGYAEVPGGKIYYKIYQSAGSDKVPLIMIHGGPGFTHHYLEPLYRLANERKVILYDQLGCGKSDKPEDLSYCKAERFVEELDALIKHLNFENVALLGHSWGGALSAEYAISHRNISHLILASPYLNAKLWLDDAEIYKNALPADVKKALETNDYSSAEFLKAHEEYYRRHVYGETKSDRSMQLSAEGASREVYNTMWGTDEFSISGNLIKFDCVPRLGKITAKTLFTAGENDTGSPRACKIAAKSIKGAQLKFFKGCAHFPHLEKRQEYLDCIRDFLNDRSLKSENIFQKITAWFN